jgi:anti-anti-sigma factor
MTQRRFVSTRRREEILTLKIEVPEIRDPEMAYAVRDELIEIVTSEGARYLIVDLADVGYMGSVGLLALLSVRRLAGVERIVLCNLNNTVRGIVFTSRLADDQGSRDKPFEYAPSIGEAEAALDAPRVTL